MNASTKMPDFLAVDFYCGAGGTTRGSWMQAGM